VVTHRFIVGIMGHYLSRLIRRNDVTERGNKRLMLRLTHAFPLMLIERIIVIAVPLEVVARPHFGAGSGKSFIEGHIVGNTGCQPGLTINNGNIAASTGTSTYV